MEDETIGPEWVFTVEEELSPICGDVNADRLINILDNTYLINYLYRGGPEPVPYWCIGDVDNNNLINILDITYLINYLYRGGPQPPDDCCD